MDGGGAGGRRVCVCGGDCFIVLLSRVFETLELYTLSNRKPRAAPEDHGRPQRPVPAHRFLPGDRVYSSNNAGRIPNATLVWGKLFCFDLFGIEQSNNKTIEQQNN